VTPRERASERAPLQRRLAPPHRLRKEIEQTASKNCVPQDESQTGHKVAFPATRIIIIIVSKETPSRRHFTTEKTALRFAVSGNSPRMTIDRPITIIRISRSLIPRSIPQARFSGIFWPQGIDSSRTNENLIRKFPRKTRYEEHLGNE